MKERNRALYSLNRWRLLELHVDSYAEAPRDGSAVEEFECELRVVRGGGYSSAGDRLRSASRGSHTTAQGLDNLGFRVARDL